MQQADNPFYRYTGIENTKFSVKNSTLLFESKNRNEFRNSEIIFSARMTSDYKHNERNEISVRWSTAPHYGDNIVKCFDVGFGITTGKTRIRYEHQHPEYSGNLAVGEEIGAPISKGYTRLKFVKLHYWDGSILFTVSQLTEDGLWKELLNTRLIGYDIEYPEGCQIAIKINGYHDDIMMSDVSVSEIEGLSIEQTQ